MEDPPLLLLLQLLSKLSHDVVVYMAASSCELRAASRSLQAAEAEARPCVKHMCAGFDAPMLICAHVVSIIQGGALIIKANFCPSCATPIGGPVLFASSYCLQRWAVSKGDQERINKRKLQLATCNASGQRTNKHNKTTPPPAPPHDCSPVIGSNC